ncbi:MAG: general stress protein [Cyanobacteriota bacterium]
MALERHRRAVGVFSNRQDAEIALRELRDSNFPMDRVSVITQDSNRQDNIAGADVRDRTAGNKADEGATTGAITGGALGGLTGLLVGLGTLAIPGIGPIMLAGAAATAIATTVAGGAIGAVTGGLLGALIGLGIPEERARVYHDRISRGHYLIVVEGTDKEIHHAQAILSHRGIEEWGVYDKPDTAANNVGSHHRAIGVFPNRRNAEAALDDLRSAGFPMSHISLVARDYDRYDRIPGLTVRDRFDNTFFGFPEERFRYFHDRFHRGDHLVIVDGTDDEVARAADILNRHRIQDWGAVDTPHLNRSHTDHATPSTPRSALVHNKRAIGVFSHRRDAETAIRDLNHAGFPMRQISLVGKNIDRDAQFAGLDVSDRPTGNQADEGAKAGAATGGVLGGLGGLLVGLGALAIPGVGPVIAGGALATALATAAAGGAIGAAAGGLTGALVGLGIPDDRARHYNDRVAHGDYLVMVDGTEDEVRRAEAILRRHGIQDWDIFDAPSDTQHRTEHATPTTHHRTEHATPTTPPRPSVGTPLGHRKHAVGVFPNSRDAKQALSELKAAGFPMHHVSVVATDADPNHPLAGVNTRNRIDNYGSLGIVEDRARAYRDRMNQGNYLVMVDGTDDEIRHAEPVLHRYGIQDYGIYDPSQVTATRQVIEPEHSQVISHEPEVIIIDHRDHT